MKDKILVAYTSRTEAVSLDRQQEMLRQARRERLAQDGTPGFTGSPSSLFSLSKWLDRLWKKHPAIFQPYKVASMV